MKNQKTKEKLYKLTQYCVNCTQFFLSCQRILRASWVINSKFTTEMPINISKKLESVTAVKRDSLTKITRKAHQDAE